MKYYLYYVENCSPQLKKFKTKKARDVFIKTLNCDNEDTFLEFSFSSDDLKLHADYYKKMKGLK